MASLTETAYAARKILKIIGVLAVSFIVLKIGSNMFISFWKTKNPPKQLPPAMRFGKIPHLNLEDVLSSQDYTYKLETPTNTLPSMPDRADIFYSPYSKPGLLALEKAKKQALLLGFAAEPEKINEKNYRWTDTVNNTTLEMNIVNSTFTIKYLWQQNQTMLTNRLSLNEEQAIGAATRILSSKELLPSDVAKDSMTTSYLRISGQKLIPAVSQSEANFIKVDFFRNDINDLPVKTAVKNTGIIQLILSGTAAPPNGLIEMTYSYFPLDYGTSSDYPLANSATLWNQFTGGSGFIISPPKNAVKEITIRRVYLGYLDTLKEQKFVQPVLFFEGDSDFLGLVPALQDQVYQ